jgi:hypothetical protein
VSLAARAAPAPDTPLGWSSAITPQNRHTAAQNSFGCEIDHA